MLSRIGIALTGARVAILGLSFKENVPDLRNSRVPDIARELLDSGVAVQLHDPHADPGDFAHEYGLDLTRLEELKPADAVILAAGHDLTWAGVGPRSRRC